VLVSFFGNHDVARFASAENSSLEKLKLAFGLVLTIRGIPQLYYGDEIGMPGGNDPDNRHDFPGGWPEDRQNAFTDTGRTPQQQQIFSYIQKLLQLRREHEALRSGRFWHLFSDNESYVFLRESDVERVVIAFNNSAQSRELRVPIRSTPAEGAAALALLFGEARASVTAGEIRLTMPTQSLSIFQLN
jgi:glycosidase